MGTSTEWQVAKTAAARYHEILSPVILGPFARALVDRVGLRREERVVDVGCGTGDGARYAAESIGNSGKVTAVDLNAGMIDVARSVPVPEGAAIDWRVANATALPLEDGSVDAVLCAQTLQFLPEKESALLEMRRVLAPGGRFGASLWTAIDDNPYFASLVCALTRHLFRPI